MNEVDKQIETLQKELKGEKRRAVRVAIENEIERLKRKRTGPASKRKTKTADGVMVGVGAVVYRYEMPRSRFVGINIPDSEYPPSIQERTISEINRVGKVRFTDWSYDLIDLERRFYSSPHAAHKAMIAEATANVKGAIKAVAVTKERVAQARHFLSVAKAFNPNAKPKVNPKAKRAA